MTNKIIYMLGIPGSGKSTFAAQISKQERAVVISTDDIRRELFGDDSKQKNTSRIYQEVFSRADEAFSLGKNAIVDATNIDRDKRMKGIARFHGVIKECYYVNTPLDICFSRNAARKRKVDDDVIAKMYKFFHFPVHGEGWDHIHIVHTKKEYDITKEDFTELLKKHPTYDELFDAFKHIEPVASMIGYNQENPHHAHPLCMHTFKVLEYINQMYEEEDKFALQVAALFHDAGKPLTKVIKKGRDYASYFLHENVSSHLCAHFLHELGFDDAFIFKVCNLVQMHMKIVYGGDEGASEIYHLLGDDYLWKLYFFSEGDSFAKN